MTNLVTGLSGRPPRCVSGVPPVQREAPGLRRLQREDPGPLHAAGPGPVLARGLPQVRLLRLPPGPGGLHPLHPGKPHPVPQGLPEVTATPPPGTKSRGWQHSDSVKLAAAPG